MFGFELHLTTRTHDLSAFVRSCQHLAVKPVIIELPFGECTHQPMLTAICHAERLSDVVCHSADLSKRLHALGFATLRTKIEIPTNDHKRFLSAHPDFNPHINYFEWHCKITFHDLNTLDLFAKTHHAHLSKNALQGQNNQRFLTIRHTDERTFLYHISISKQRIDINKITS